MPFAEAVKSCHHSGRVIAPAGRVNKVKSTPLASALVPEKEMRLLGLVLEARSRMDDFDEVWVVFDRNGYTKHKEAFELAAEPVNGKRVHIAFSSIAFEMWVLLHFEKSNMMFAKSAGIVQLLHDGGYFPGYEKKAYIDTFSFLKDRTLQAMENAAWLRHELEKAGVLDGRPLYELNPYTDVDVLVARLLEVHEKWLWGWPGVLVSIGEIGLLAEKLDGDAGLSVTVTNDTGSSVLFNAANIAGQFSIRAGTKMIQVSIDKTTQVAPGGQGVFVTAGIVLQFVTRTLPLDQPRFGY